LNLQQTNKKQEAKHEAQLRWKRRPIKCIKNVPKYVFSTIQIYCNAFL